MKVDRKEEVKKEQKLDANEEETFEWKTTKSKTWE